MSLGFVFLGPDAVQASSNLPVPSSASDGAATKAPWVAANQYAPTNATVIFTAGGAATITAAILWGYSIADAAWYQLGALDASISVTSSTQGVARLVNAVGCWDRLAVSGTGTSVTVTFRPTAVFGS